MEQMIDHLDLTNAEGQSLSDLRCGKESIAQAHVKKRQLRKQIKKGLPRMINYVPVRGRFGRRRSPFGDWSRAGCRASEQRPRDDGSGSGCR
jgi:hypothetical protein